MGVSEASVKCWFAAFRKGGFDVVLERGNSGGRPSGLDEEVETYLLNGLEHAPWNTAEQAREELEKHFERRFTYHMVGHW